MDPIFDKNRKQMSRHLRGVHSPRGFVLNVQQRYPILASKLSIQTASAPATKTGALTILPAPPLGVRKHIPLIHIFRYAKRRSGRGVFYKNRGHTQIVGYLDANQVGSPINRCSTSRYRVFTAGNLIGRVRNIMQQIDLLLKLVIER